MDVKPGFRKTDVGVIPNDWKVAKLSEVCSMKSGEGITSASIDLFSKYPCYGGNGLRGYTSSFTHDGCYALIGRQGALCGNVLVVSGKIFASEHAVVVTASTVTDIYWLTYVLGEMRLNQYSESSAQPGLSVSKLLNLELSVAPTKAEQTAIAETLSDVDALIGSLGQLIAKKRQIKQGAMQELLTGKKRLPGFDAETVFKQTEVGAIPEDWDVSTLGDTCIFENGDRGHNYPSKSAFVASGVPFINAGHVEDGRISRGSLDYIRREHFDLLGGGKTKPGDVLFCLRGSLGKFGVVAAEIPEGAIASSLIIIRPIKSKLSLGFFICYLKSNLCVQMIEVWAGGAAQPNLGGRDLARFGIPLPATKAEQDAIAETLNDMDAEIAGLEAKLDKTRLAKQGMMQELLTGRIRLI
jgi:type I restriction enzyme, S subunit